MMSKSSNQLLETAREAPVLAGDEFGIASDFHSEPFDVAAIRKRLRLSQGKFAARFGLSVATLRDWEQGRRQPDRYARALLKVIDYAPLTVERAIGAQKVDSEAGLRQF